MLTNKATFEVAVHFIRIPHTCDGRVIFNVNVTVLIRFRPQTLQSDVIDRLLVTRGLLECSAALFGAPRLKSKKKSALKNTEFVIINFRSHS